MLAVNPRTSAGDDVSGTERVVNQIVAGRRGLIARVTCPWSLTGLTQRQSYTYRLGFRKSDPHLTGLIHAGDDAAGGWGAVGMLARAGREGSGEA